jgi:acyl-CoA thioester hydrolase
MNKSVEPSAFFFAPFVSSPMRIDPQWIDYNGHLNMAYYTVLCDRAIDEAFAVIGLGPDYARSRRASVFTAEAHIQYRRELVVGDPVRATVQLVDYDDKRLHVYVELRHAEEAWLSASLESMNLHVGLEDRKVTPFPPEILANIAVMKSAHAHLPRPEALGRVIGIPARARSGRPGLH